MTTTDQAPARAAGPDTTPHAAGAFASIRLVARREFVERIRDKSFVISTLVVLFMVAGIVLLPQLLGFGDPSRFEVVVVGEDGARIGSAVAEAAEAFELDVELVTVGDVAAGEEALREGDADLLVTGDELVVERDGDQQLLGLAQTASGQLRVVERLEGAGLSPTEIGDALGAEPLAVRSLDPPDPEQGARVGFAFVGLFLLYGQLFGYGFSVASGVVEEKSSRVVEILLATVKPTHLLAGKIIGIGLLGLVQLLLMAGLALGLVVTTGAVELPPGTFGLVVQLLGWFLLGYLLYSCLFAGVGALVSRTEELQSVMTPFTFVILGSFLASFAALNDPTSTVGRVASFVPPSAPLAMPIRIAQQAAAGWEIALSVGLLLAAIAIAVPVGARLYLGGVLRTGSNLRFREAWRGAKR